ncbi:hypothetical protein ABB25_07080 [Stenotrophomonas koreensis]|uniref:Uncharacterized protein n=1 Tax=Stenotrophomonas koreensis TaxID=266128 RepID=A0A0R0BM81_9GAMM|nr:hypothetical protein ABB25_07080 [Stenotrophomonas koreensis]
MAGLGQCRICRPGQAAAGSLADRLVAMQHDLQARNAREQVLNQANAQISVPHWMPRAPG